MGVVFVYGMMMMAIYRGACTNSDSFDAGTCFRVLGSPKVH